MDYKKHYDRLIDRAKNRELNGYVEKHHIIPRCMGGGDVEQNIAVLTAEEHFIAHKLLFKIHPTVKGLALALLLFTGNRWRDVNNKIVGATRRKAKEAMKGRVVSDETRRKISVARTGFKFPEDWVSPNKGRPGTFSGKTHTEGSKKIMSEKKKGKIPPAVHLRRSYAGEGNPFYGKKHQPESIAKAVAAKAGFTHSEESKRKTSMAMSRLKWFNNPTTSEKIRISQNAPIPEGFVAGRGRMV